MVLMSGMELPSRAIREQIQSAVDIIIHESRLSEGARKVGMHGYTYDGDADRLLQTIESLS